MIINRRLRDLEEVAAALTAAGISVPRGLATGPTRPDGSQDLFTYDANGQPVDLPAAAAAVLAAYAPTRQKRPAEYLADFQTAAGHLQTARGDLLVAQTAYTNATTALQRENALRDGLAAVNTKVEAVQDEVLVLAKAMLMLTADRVPDAD